MRTLFLVLLLCAGCGPTSETLEQPTPADLDPDNRDSMSIRLELFVEDVTESLDFYIGVMGFEVLPGGGADYTAIVAGNVTLGLGPRSGLGDYHYFNPELQSSRIGLGTEIVLEVDDVESYFAAVDGAGWPTLSPLTARPWGLTDFRLADPDGYYIRMTSRPED